eukprot:366299-Chlamydomonas_euryale.AAC.7
MLKGLGEDVTDAEHDKGTRGHSEGVNDGAGRRRMVPRGGGGCGVQAQDMTGIRLGPLCNAYTFHFERFEKANSWFWRYCL